MSWIGGFFFFFGVHVCMLTSLSLCKLDLVDTCVFPYTFCLCSRHYLNNLFLMGTYQLNTPTYCRLSPKCDGKWNNNIVYIPKVSPSRNRLIKKGKKMKNWNLHVTRLNQSKFSDFFLSNEYRLNKSGWSTSHKILISSWITEWKQAICDQQWLLQSWRWWSPYASPLNVSCSLEFKHQPQTYCIF